MPRLVELKNHAHNELVSRACCLGDTCHTAIPPNAGGLGAWGLLCPFPFALEVSRCLGKMLMTIDF